MTTGRCSHDEVATVTSIAGARTRTLPSRGDPICSPVFRARKLRALEVTKPCRSRPTGGLSRRRGQRPEVRSTLVAVAAARELTGFWVPTSTRRVDEQELTQDAGALHICSILHTYHPVQEYPTLEE